jgi:hypothetical protein
VVARYAGAFSTSMALHAALAVLLAWPATVPSPQDGESGRHIEVVLLPPPEDSSFPGVKPVERSRAHPHGEDFTGEGPLAGADVQRIADHVLVLFPFVSPGLALDAFFRSPASSAHLVFENPYARPPARPARRGRRLEMNAAALQTLVDQSWTRANRWKAFAAIRQLTEDGDADDDRLASLIALYRDQNALQPYADGTVRDLRLWAQLGLAADHVDFIGFIRRFAAAHPSTRVTTELLFLLDTIAQANEDALAVLVETDQPDDLVWTLRTHPRAYDLARQIQRDYARELARLGLTSRAEVEAFYARGRVAILLRILETTPKGYRADEARFLIGEILWTQARREEALRAWRGLSAPTADNPYAVAIAQIRAALNPAEPDMRNIGFILRNQEGRWLSFSDDRLRRFGYRADTY